MGGIPLEQKRILLVDDESDLLESYGMLLQESGYHVTTEDGGWPAFERLKSETFDAVVTDVRMLKGDGIEFLEKVQSQLDRKPPIIIMSGFADVLPNDLLDRGACAFLAKPLQFKQLLNSLARALMPRTQRWMMQAGAGDVTPIPLDRDFANFEESLVSGELDFGQGGFFLQLDGVLPAAESIVSFRLSFQTGAIRSLLGVGVVRWTRTAARHGFRRGVGVEILSLDASVIQSLDEVIQKMAPRAFVPIGCMANMRA